MPMGTSVGHFKPGVDVNQLFLQVSLGKRIGGARVGAKRLRNIRHQQIKHLTVANLPPGTVLAISFYSHTLPEGRKLISPVYARETEAPGGPSLQ